MSEAKKMPTISLSLPPTSLAEWTFQCNIGILMSSTCRAESMMWLFVQKCFYKICAKNIIFMMSSFFFFFFISILLHLPRASRIQYNGLVERSLFCCIPRDTFISHPFYNLSLVLLSILRKKVFCPCRSKRWSLVEQLHTPIRHILHRAH